MNFLRRDKGCLLTDTIGSISMRNELRGGKYIGEDKETYRERFR